MKKYVALILCLALICTMVPALACTGFVAGKGATADGSLIMGRTEDIGSAYNKNILVNPASAAEGEMTLTDPYNGFTIQLPAAYGQWTMVSDVPEHDDGLYAEACMNQYGVSLTATVSTGVNDAVKEFDPLVENGLREAYLPNVVIPYAKTAKEGVQMLGKVIEEYGSAEGNTVIFADADEAWVMEIVSGHEWAAVKVPDDCYAVIPNCMMIGYVDVNDTDNYLCSPTLFSMPEEKGFLKTLNDQPHVALTYAPEMSDGNRVRAWGGQHYFSASQEIPYDAEVFSLFQKPDEKIALTDAMGVLAYRYEGTEYDVNEHPEVRAIGVEGTSEAHLFQYKENGVLTEWQTLGNPEHTVFLPMYPAIADTPDAFKVTGRQYNADSAYWTLRGLSALCEIDRTNYGAGVKAYWKLYQQQLIDKIAACDAEYAALSGEEQAKYATELFAEVSADALEKAKVMTDELMYFICKRGSMAKQPRAPFVPSLMPAAE